MWLRCGNQTTETVERILRGHIWAIRAFEDDSIVACLELS
ncbi:MAG TPA: hypothetical protein VG537_00815 [Candidatus Kapabacteria bacterium]|nr:hypothetical protein [Candidatus Kapabacteria bacterium]